LFRRFSGALESQLELLEPKRIAYILNILKEVWPLNECVFYVQIQAAKAGLYRQFIGLTVVKLFCLTNRKSGNQLWRLGPVQEICIFSRGHASFFSYKYYFEAYFITTLLDTRLVGNEKVETLIDFFVLSRVRVYTKKGIEAATFYIRVYLPELRLMAMAL